VTTPAIDRGVIENLRQLNQEGQPDLVREVLTVFLHDSPRRVSAIANAAEQRNGPELQRSAHALKGAAGTIGAFQLQDCCRELETAGRNNTFDETTVLLEEMRNQLERVRGEIARLL
jgi:HPt (histidine-containing phosphotransfer) domain-containing protein